MNRLMPDNHPMSPPMSEYPLKITATSSEPQKQSKRRFQGVRRWYLGGLLASTGQCLSTVSNLHWGNCRSKYQ